ncbi:SDR family oxidoreductase [Allopusillimonas soli]|uniref:SDR family oxidoreductase n=1 Tax=Allopusillimonas soli TaxID=659016 RepID=A0A853F644_9BURK|nr:SDR family oxidoreductase [Allopusillimonas soli]NYT36025.1 SDR family oxidoreductase [Allopusillimonas soli]TEA76368.1 SDR family oxidoreductase [Allopusillimonas soli]
MDIGLKGKWALVCGASKGLGYACAAALAEEGAHLVMVSRTSGPLQESARRIAQETGVQAVPVAADISTPEGRAMALRACPQVDILITNAGGPKAGDFRELTPDDWQAALQANMLAPIELIKATVNDMIARKFGRIVNITSAAVKSPVDILCLSNGARAGLTGFAAGVARQLAPHNVTLNNLLPGKFDTDRLRANNAVRAERAGVPLEAETRRQADAIPAGRFGVPAEFGHACAFLCSAHAGYITGQNLLIDGGAYPGLL